MLTTTACSSTNQFRYVGSFPIGVSSQSTHQYLIERLRALGWRIFTRQTYIGHIIAANNETTETRDVVSIDLLPNGDLSLWIRTEIANHGFVASSRWIAPSGVCTGYTWAREQQLLNQILNR